MTQRASLRRPSRRHPRGFTLVELMVAITGGLFVSLAVFAIARESGRFYNREARISDATLGAVLGFERLKTDVARAGFLGTPNVKLDPHLCVEPTQLPSWPYMMQRLASLSIDNQGSPSNTTLNAAGNALFPDSVVLMGSYTGAEQFAIWGVDKVSSTYEVFLQQNTGPLARLGYATTTDKAGMLRSVFRKGAALRFQDQSGEVQFAQISDIGTNPPKVILTQTPLLRFRDEPGAICGLKGNVTGATVNVINFVRYQVRKATDPAYNAVYASGGHPYDADRTDLIREELDVTGNQIPNTEEIVAEYAVDLQFGITVVDSMLNNAPSSVLQIPPGNAGVETWAGDLVNNVSNPANGPQRVRVVRTRLTVRSQHPDRPENPGPPGLLRVGVGTSGSAPFARIRTLQADIAMNNQMAETY